MTRIECRFTFLPLILWLSALWPGQGLSRPQEPATSASPAQGPGVIVVRVNEGEGAASAGIQPEDCLVGWEARGETGAPGSPGESAGGRIENWADWLDMLVEQPPRHPVRLIGDRSGTRLQFDLGQFGWGIHIRPALPGELLDSYQSGRQLGHAGEAEKAATTWLEAARQGLADQRWEAAAYLATEAGRIYQGLRRWSEARQGLELATEAAGQTGSPILQAWMWELRGDLGRASGDFAAAELACRSALQIREGVAPESLGVARSCNAGGITAAMQGKLDQARPLLQRAVALRERLGPGSLELAESLENLSILETSRGDFGTAEECLARALAIRERLTPGSRRFAMTLGSLGVLQWNLGRLNDAENTFSKALTILAQLAPGTLDYARIANNLALILKDRSRVTEAESRVQEALAIIQREQPGGPDEAAARQNLGTIALDNEDMETGITFLREALAVFEKLEPDSLSVATCCENLGVAAEKRGDLFQAERYYQRALAIRRRLTPGSAAEASSLVTLGRLALQRIDYASAEPLFREALELWQKSGVEPVKYIDQLNGLGLTLRFMGRYPEAEACFRQALAASAESAPESLAVASALCKLGDLYYLRREFSEAAELYGKSLNIQEKLAPGRLSTAAVHHNLGLVAQAQHDYALAEACLLKALAIRNRVAPGSAWEAETLYALGDLHRSQNQKAPALDFFQRAVAALESQRGRLGGAVEPTSGFANRSASYYWALVELLLELGRRPEAFGALERGRARSLLELMAHRELRFATEIPLELELERRRLRVEYDRCLARLEEPSAGESAPDAAETSRTLGNIRRRQEEIRAEIIRSSARLAALQYPAPLDLAEARRQLPPGTLLLEYLVGESKSYLFAVGPRRGDFSVYTLPAGADKLRRLVQDFRTRLQQQAPALAESTRLSDILLAPARKRLPGATRLLVCPDGPLHFLPFAALRDPNAGQDRFRFLVETLPLHEVVSMTVYAGLQGQPATGLDQNWVAFGDPDYAAGSDPGPSARTRSALLHEYVGRTASLEPLEFSRREVAAIASLNPERTQVWTGAEASEERARSIGPGAGLVHFACHGLTFADAPLESALVLAAPGASAGGEDGLLQAWEIFEQLRLQADLVTLSACETGLGQELGGEGLIGLTRAFQFAGARSIVATLWPIADESTARLMARFYQELKQGQGKAESLRRAQLELIQREDRTLAGKDFSHPYHWAGFSLIGPGD